MKGLFAKELAILTTSLKRNVLFVALFYGFISVASRQPYMAYALAFFFTLICLSTISFDENSHWDTYVRTMPVTPAQIIGCKYLCTLGGLVLGMLAAAGITAIINLVCTVWVFEPGAISFPADVAATLLVCGGMVLLFAALLLPLSYKFNSVNARSWLFLLIAGFAGLGGLLIAILPAELRGDFITLLNNTDEASALLMLAALFAVMLLVYGISYRVCVRIYEKKEY